MMNHTIKFIGVLIFIVTIIGCHSKPYSKDYIYTAQDDHLSLQSKVDILRNTNTVNDEMLLASISLMYAQNKNWIEAKYSIQKAIKLAPLNSSYHLYLANYNAELNQHIEAYEQAKIAFELGTYDKKLEEILARMAIETGDTLNSSKFVTAYYKDNASNLEARLLMARLYVLESKYAEALELAKNILVQDSANVMATKVAYESYLKLDSTHLAIVFGNRLLKEDSVNAQYYFQIGNLYLTSNQANKAANYFAKSYKHQPLLPSLYLALGNYNNMLLYDSVLFYTDSAFVGVHQNDKYILWLRAQAFDKKYIFDESYMVYDKLTKMDSTDSLVNAEKAIIQRKIAYLQRKKREQKQLADSLANAMPRINF